MTGYIKLYRSLMDKGYYRDSEYVHLWVHLIMKATYQEKEYLFNGKIEHLQPGQFITGIHALSKETGIHRSKVERILRVFETEKQIEKQTTNKFRIISICNWSEYQESENQNEKPARSQREASEKPARTNNKDKKEKKKNMPESGLSLFDSFYQKYPVKKAKQEAIKAWNKLKPENGTIELILSAIQKQKDANEASKKKGEFVPEWPYPATWLNGKRWEDSTDTAEPDKPSFGLSPEQERRIKEIEEQEARNAGL